MIRTTRCSLHQILLNKIPLPEDKLQLFHLTPTAVLRRSICSTKQPSRYVNSVTSIPAFITHILIVTDHPMGEHISTLTELYSAVSEQVKLEHISTLTELYSAVSEKVQLEHIGTLTELYSAVSE